ncbi:MAG: hypothetical protein ACMG6S_13165 [Byssovorax sp.]
MTTAINASEAMVTPKKSTGPWWFWRALRAYPEEALFYAPHEREKEP